MSNDYVVQSGDVTRLIGNVTKLLFQLRGKKLYLSKVGKILASRSSLLPPSKGVCARVFIAERGSSTFLSSPPFFDHFSFRIESRRNSKKKREQRYISFVRNGREVDKWRRNDTSRFIIIHHQWWSWSISKKDDSWALVGSLDEPWRTREMKND